MTIFAAILVEKTGAGGGRDDDCAWYQRSCVLRAVASPFCPQGAVSSQGSSGGSGGDALRLELP